ncbi:MAG: GNAT family N-acetyltransferase [Deltaproteobacteria bacterium]|nr:GNAT family N-acetyltransferase [Deltaproteobacteria bacterium]
MDGGVCAGRFALIKDEKLNDYVQVAFFEADWGLENLSTAIKMKARQLFTEATKIVVGVCGHLNYAAGFLANKFREPPVFGLPYNPPYYLEYFQEMDERELVSFRFSNQQFFDLRKQGKLMPDIGKIRLRHLDKSNLKRDVEIYTKLNNQCFPEHPYWSDRTSEEDYELFHPFRWLLKEENLIIAEDQGRPVGFLLWYPDFNQLVEGGQELSISQVLKYHLLNPVDTVRLTEIAVIPEYRRKGVVQAMVADMTDSLARGNYKYTEGGFIFSENKASIGITSLLLQKAFGKPVKPYRRFVVFDGNLS